MNEKTPEKEEKIKYKTLGMRLHDETIRKLRLKQKKSGKSWNLFILDLIEKKK